TAASFLIVDDDILNAYYGKVPGSESSDDAGGYIFPCNATLPSISFKLGGHKVKIPGSTMMFEDLGDNICFGALQSNNGGRTIFGDTFFKEQFVVFDVGKTRIGLANKP
ncbi:hypothetical protein GP486_008809, partial [Trichoglossum hirsutum]